MDVEITKESWKEFFECLNERRFEWRTAIEVLSPEVGDQALTSNLRLNGFTVETKGDQTSINISLGEDVDAHQTHTINDPLRVAYHVADGAVNDVIDIEEANGTKTLVTFLEPSEIAGHFSTIDLFSPVI